ncbi:DUF433 domain-containing protein [Sphingobium cloacae]|uniref:DUF433 domain-containing protein n=1 Tax=Sphingobium cloacae TaxID=120107 RepID=A0A1E1EXS3_9SPHN|nr:DUF433 domain-containing protein [Sphingobium cloacae]BAV63066.1 hypothetical protein SCLO_1000260 [Sphingobium cloacae]
MPATARLFTPSEAAAVTGIGVKAVNNAIDKQIVKAAKPAPGAGSARRALTVDDLLRVKLWYKVGDILSQERRERLFDAIRQQPKARTVKADDLLIIDVGEARKQIAARTRDLEAAEAMVSQDKEVMGGEPVFRGTRIPVRLIASMLTEGTDAAEILEGYPRLGERQLTLATIWVSAHPRRGRPKSLKDRGFKLKSVRRTTLRRDPRATGTGTAG